MSIPMRILLNRLTSVLCSALLIPFSALSAVPELAQPWSQASDQSAPKIPNDQIDSLVAPIALYPDPLLAQVLAASTYPLELVQLQQWLGQHKDLKDQALADAVEKHDWDPSIQALAALPDVVKRLTDDIKWTTDLGNAFLAQQSDVMDAVQRMRAKAQSQGNLNSTEQMKVETKVVESKQVIVIEQANPQVVYVPSYNPVVVYGPPVYPYPPIYYPPPGYYAAGLAISFGVGVAMGAFWSGGWGWGCGWGSNNKVTINNNNNFNRNVNISGGNRNNLNGGNRPSQQPGRGGSGGNNWQHNPQHRGGTPYSNKTTADRFGGTTRGSTQAARQESARQSVGRQQSSGQQVGASNRGNAGAGQAGNRGAGGGQAGNRGAGGAIGAGQGGGRTGTGGTGVGQGGNRGGAGGAGSADRIGNRSVSSSGGSGSAPRGGGAGGLGGSGAAASGGGARASSARGASSMGGGGGGRKR